MRFAAAYGFRNIQNVVLKLKKGKFPYHFVEVLACAGGKTQGPRLSWAPPSPVGNGPYWPPPASLSSKGFVGVWMLPWWLWHDGPSHTHILENAGWEMSPWKTSWGHGPREELLG